MATRTPGRKIDDITQWEDEQPVTDILYDDMTDVFPEAPGVPAESGPEIPERAPIIKQDTSRRVKETLTRIATRSKAPVKSVTKKPRVSVENVISVVWEGLARLASPVNPPVARVMAMQAPVAGKILDGPLKDTVIDRILQPFARMEESGGAVFALLAPPMIVGTITSNPQTAPLLLPILRQALASWMKLAGPHLKEVEKLEEDFENEYGKRIDDMIKFFLGYPDATVESTGN